jgi:hypothetical protein
MREPKNFYIGNCSNDWWLRPLRTAVGLIWRNPNSASCRPGDSTAGSPTNKPSSRKSPPGEPDRNANKTRANWHFTTPNAQRHGPLQNGRAMGLPRQSAPAGFQRFPRIFAKRPRAQLTGLALATTLRCQIQEEYGPWKSLTKTGRAYIGSATRGLPAPPSRSASSHRARRYRSQHLRSTEAPWKPTARARRLGSRLESIDPLCRGPVWPRPRPPERARSSTQASSKSVSDHPGSSIAFLSGQANFHVRPVGA